MCFLHPITKSHESHENAEKSNENKEDCDEGNESNEDSDEGTGFSVFSRRS